MDLQPPLGRAADVPGAISNTPFPLTVFLRAVLHSPHGFDESPRGKRKINFTQQPFCLYLLLNPLRQFVQRPQPQAELQTELPTELPLAWGHRQLPLL